MKEVEILSLGPFYAPAFALMEQEFTVHKLWQAKDPAGLIAEVGARIRGIQAMHANKTDAKLMDALPKLEIISCFGVGVDGVDLEAARKRAIDRDQHAGVLNECVADLALGLTLATIRRISLGDRYVRAGSWLKGPLPFTHSMGGKIMGILGYGRIGKAIAKRAEPSACASSTTGASRRRTWRTNTMQT